MKKDNIKVDTTTLDELFTNYKRFIVPGYQRPYEWGREQVETLLDDITKAFGDKPDDIILLGTIQLNEIYGVDRLKYYEIIDGHQRITTLYLLLEALHGTPVIEYKNIIQGYTSIKPEAIRKDRAYTDNYDYICKYFSNTSEEYKSLLRAFIYDKVSFISITIKDCSSIEDTLNIFNTLNTTGLQLQVKDIFKIKFAEYLKNKNFNGDDYGVFERINKAYEDVLHPIEDNNEFDIIYELKEGDLLDTYRFYLMSTENKDSFTADLRNSSNSYFADIFEGKKNLNLCIDDFCDIANCIKKTQQRLKYLDQKQTGKFEILNNCCKELMDWSGYERLKNLYYYLMYLQWKNGSSEITNEMIENTNAVMSIIWKYSAVNRFIYSKIINDVFSKVGELLFKKDPGLNSIDFSTIKDRVIKKDFYRNMSKDQYFDSFKKLLQVNNDTFDCNKPHLLLALSYIDDIDQAASFEIKRDIFYRSSVYGKWGLDIEHILSRKLHEQREYVNSIGNLMYLTSKTNKYLGTQTKGIQNNDQEKDFEIKKKAYSCKDDSKILICVKKFMEQYSSSISFINSRDKQKVDYLRNVFEYEGFEKTNG